MSAPVDNIGPVPATNVSADKAPDKTKIELDNSASEDASSAQDPRGIKVMQHQAIHQIWTKGPLIAVFAG